MNQIAEHMLRDKFATLLYLEDPRTFDGTKGMEGQSTGPYRICLQMPIAEFTGSTPMDIVVDFVRHTTAGEWCETRRRSVLPGDMVCIGAQPWLVIKRDQMKYFPINLIQTAGVWPDGAIVMLHPGAVSSMPRDKQDPDTFDGMGVCDLPHN